MKLCHPYFSLLMLLNIVGVVGGTILLPQVLGRVTVLSLALVAPADVVKEPVLILNGTGGTLETHHGGADQGLVLLALVGEDRFRDQVRGQETQEETDGEGERTDQEGSQPLVTIQGNSLESLATKGDNDVLATNDNGLNEDKDLVVVEVLEDVEGVIDAATVELVEDLEENEGVEDHGAEDLEVVGGDVNITVLVGRLEVEELGAKVEEGQVEDDLEDGLADDHLPHVEVDQGCVSVGGLTLEDFGAWGLSGEGEGGEGIHDQVDPEELDSREDRLVVLRGDGRDEGQHDSGDVDGKLELQELADRVVDGTAPHKGLED